MDNIDVLHQAVLGRDVGSGCLMRVLVQVLAFTSSFVLTGHHRSLSALASALIPLAPSLYKHCSWQHHNVGHRERRHRH
jgi:hypothetical protein